jgi:arsenite methyltransferase
MKTAEELKNIVKQKYSEIALQDKGENMASCCGAGGCSTEVYNIMTDDYSQIEGYNADADLGLGCGIPTEYARMKPGDVVLDLGSGAGNDAFVARRAVGENGKVIGVDFTEAMINRARENADKAGYNNVEFRYGDIEKIPVRNAVADVVLSNCVLNLVPDKAQVFREIFRVLKPGGNFSVSDIVLTGELPPAVLKDAEMYAGCVSGAIQEAEYLKYIEAAGFSKIKVFKKKRIQIPADILSRYLSDEEIKAFHQDDKGIYSISVYGEKSEACCAPGCCGN